MPYLELTQFTALLAESEINIDSVISTAFLNNAKGTKRVAGWWPRIVPSWAFCSPSLTIADSRAVTESAAVSLLSIVSPFRFVCESDINATPLAVRVFVKA